MVADMIRKFLQGRDHQLVTGIEIPMIDSQQDMMNVSMMIVRQVGMMNDNLQDMTTGNPQYMMNHQEVCYQSLDQLVVQLKAQGEMIMIHMEHQQEDVS